MDTLTRFWSRVTVTSPDQCWEWSGGRDAYGYGVFYVGKRQIKAHRFAYEASTSTPIPDGLVIDHLCANRGCVNPHHMEPVTQAENVARGNRRAAQARETCRAGHPYSETNTRVTRKQRVCRVCKNLNRKARRVEATP